LGGNRRDEQSKDRDYASNGIRRLLERLRRGSDGDVRLEGERAQYTMT